jgi:hypothetical protein
MQGTRFVGCLVDHCGGLGCDLHVGYGLRIIAFVAQGQRFRQLAVDLDAEDCSFGSCSEEGSEVRAGREAPHACFEWTVSVKVQTINYPQDLGDDYPDDCDHVVS